jgi:hypothetical protein
MIVNLWARFLQQPELTFRIRQMHLAFGRLSVITTIS